MVLDVFSLSPYMLKSLLGIVEDAKAEPPLHSLAGKSPVNVTPVDVTERAVTFIRKYASVHGMPQPAAPRGRAGVAPMYLPTSLSNLLVYKCYAECEEDDGVSYEVFRRTWVNQCSDVEFIKPQTDVCPMCERLRDSCKHAKTEEEMQNFAKKLNMHLSTATDEREYYNDMLSTAAAE